MKGLLFLKNIIKMNTCYKQAKIYMVWKDQLEEFERTGNIEVLKRRLMAKEFPLLKFIKFEKLLELEKEIVDVF